MRSPPASRPPELQRSRCEVPICRSPNKRSPRALELAWKESCCSCAISWPKRKNPICSAATERSVELVALHPGATPRYETGQPLLHAPIGLRPPPGRLQSALRNLVRMSVVRPQEGSRAPPRHCVPENIVRQEPLTDQGLERDRGRAAAEERSVVGRRVVRRGLALRPELQAMEAEIGGEAEKCAPSAREGRAPPRVVGGVPRQGQIVDGEQQTLDAERFECVTDQLAQRFTPGSARADRALGSLPSRACVPPRTGARKGVSRAPARRAGAGGSVRHRAADRPPWTHILRGRPCARARCGHLALPPSCSQRQLRTRTTSASRRRPCRERASRVARPGCGPVRLRSRR